MTIATQPVQRLNIALAEDDHEQIVIRQDAETGLRLIVAVHSTVLGPSLGGMRLKRYAGGLREALDDVMGLSRTMTLKASAAGLDLGGGKAVMIDDGNAEMREARLEGAAHVIDRLKGAYVTAEDIGTTCADMDFMSPLHPLRRRALGRERRRRRPLSRHRGDRLPGAAAWATSATGSPELDGRRIGVIGLGKVGSVLAAQLSAGGARILAYDLDPMRSERFRAEHGGEIAVSAERRHGRAARRTGAVRRRPDDRRAAGALARLPRRGGGGQQPAHRHAPWRDVLNERGILYVPDFLANCGGLIHVSREWYGKHGPGEEELIAGAMDRLELAIETARAENSTPIEVAERQALERIAAARA